MSKQTKYSKVDFWQTYEDQLVVEATVRQLTEDEYEHLYNVFKKLCACIWQNDVRTSLPEFQKELIISDTITFGIMKVLPSFVPEKYTGRRMNYFTLCMKRFIYQAIARYLKTLNESVSIIQENEFGEPMELPIIPDPSLNWGEQSAHKELEFDMVLWKELYAFYQKYPPAQDKVRRLLDAINKTLNGELPMNKSISDKYQNSRTRLLYSHLAEKSGMHNNSVSHTIWNLLSRFYKFKYFKTIKCNKNSYEMKKQLTQFVQAEKLIASGERIDTALSASLFDLQMIRKPDAVIETEYHSYGEKVTVNCLGCKKEFVKYITKKQQWCSTQCYRKYSSPIKYPEIHNGSVYQKKSGWACKCVGCGKERAYSSRKSCLANYRKTKTCFSCKCKIVENKSLNGVVA